MKSTMEDDNTKDKVPEDDCKTVVEKCKEVINWLDTNQTASKEEYEDKQKELEGVCMPIVTKLYQASVVLQVVCQEECLEECLVDSQVVLLVAVAVEAVELDQQSKRIKLKNLN